MDKSINFKKVGFGGYDKDEVNAYISHMTDSFEKYKEECEKQAEELKKKLEEAEKLCAELKMENDALKAGSGCFESGSVSKNEVKTVVKELSDGIEKLRRIIENNCLNDEPDGTAEVNSCGDEELDSIISKYL